MTRRYGVTIIESYASSRFANDFNAARQFAERTLFTLFTRQFIEMIVLIQFTNQKYLYVATVFENIFPNRLVVNMSDCGICILNSYQLIDSTYQAAHELVCRSRNRFVVWD